MQGVSGDYKGVQGRVLEFQERFRVFVSFMGVPGVFQRDLGSFRECQERSWKFQRSSSWFPGFPGRCRGALGSFWSVRVSRCFQGIPGGFKCYGCSRGTHEISRAAKHVLGCSRRFQSGTTWFQEISGEF